jgi:hypothetical protein
MLTDTQHPADRFDSQAAVRITDALMTSLNIFNQGLISSLVS